MKCRPGPARGVHPTRILQLGLLQEKHKIYPIILGSPSELFVASLLGNGRTNSSRTMRGPKEWLSRSSLACQLL